MSVYHIFRGHDFTCISLKRSVYHFTQTQTISIKKVRRGITIEFEPISIACTQTASKFIYLFSFLPFIFDLRGNLLIVY